jgi:hypothetical protein
MIGVIIMAMQCGLLGCCATMKGRSHDVYHDHLETLNIWYTQNHYSEFRDCIGIHEPICVSLCI